MHLLMVKTTKFAHWSELLVLPGIVDMFGLMYFNIIKNGVENMPWCPNCNAEYQEGYKECSDCGVALVDSLEENEVELVPFFQAEDKKMAEKLVSYFNYSNLPSEMAFNEKNEVYVVCIPPKMEKEARKLYQAFYFVERENIENGIYKDSKSKSSKEVTDDENYPDTMEATHTPNPMEEVLVDGFVPEHANDDQTEVYYDPEDEPEDEGVEKGVYIFKADRYRDLAGTVSIFLFFGIIGLAFVILNMAGILSVLNGWMPNTVMGALFIGFLYVAFSTKQKANNIRDEIATENKMTEEINSWLKEHITADYLTSIYNDNVSEELNYIKMTDTIKKQLIENFGDQNPSYLDRLVEEYYNNNF